MVNKVIAIMVQCLSLHFPLKWITVRFFAQILHMSYTFTVTMSQSQILMTAMIVTMTKVVWIFLNNMLIYLSSWQQLVQCTVNDNRCNWGPQHVTERGIRNSYLIACAIWLHFSSSYWCFCYFTVILWESFNHLNVSNPQPPELLILTYSLAQNRLLVLMCCWAAILTSLVSKCWRILHTVKMY